VISFMLNIGQHMNLQQAAGASMTVENLQSIPSVFLTVLDNQLFLHIFVSSK